MPKQLLLLILLLFVIGGAFYLTLDRDEPGGSGGGQVKVGDPAPDFTLKDLDGNPVTLSQYRGKAVFLNFWASWCPPCREEMPAMERLNQALAGKDFVMLAVNVEQDLGTVRAFLQGTPHSFAVPLDPEGKVQRLYDVYRFPETYLIDRQGRIVRHYLGARDWSSVEFIEYLSVLSREEP